MYRFKLDRRRDPNHYPIDVDHFSTFSSSYVLNPIPLPFHCPIDAVITSIISINFRKREKKRILSQIKANATRLSFSMTKVKHDDTTYQIVSCVKIQPNDWETHDTHLRKKKVIRELKKSKPRESTKPTSIITSETVFFFIWLTQTEKREVNTLQPRAPVYGQKFGDLITLLKTKAYLPNGFGSFDKKNEHKEDPFRSFDKKWK